MSSLQPADAARRGTFSGHAAAIAYFSEVNPAFASLCESAGEVERKTRLLLAEDEADVAEDLRVEARRAIESIRQKQQVL